MGILNIDEHVEEHRLMAIRYPSKAVIPGTNVIAQVNIPFLIMPGDGAANGCQFTGTNGTFTLSAAIIANIGTSLAGCYAYFSAGFGGSSLPAGWYWTEFSSDTAGIVYAETYTSGKVSRPTTKTAITPNLSGWVTGTTNEIVGPQGFVLSDTALGKNGNLQTLFTMAASTSGTHSYRGKIGGTNYLIAGNTSSPVSEVLNILTCLDSYTEKFTSRPSTSTSGGVGLSSATFAPTTFQINTNINQTISFSLQQSTNTAGAILMRLFAVATYGD